MVNSQNKNLAIWECAYVCHDLTTEKKKEFNVKRKDVK